MKYDVNVVNLRPDNKCSSALPIQSSLWRWQGSPVWLQAVTDQKSAPGQPWNKSQAAAQGQVLFTWMHTSLGGVAAWTAFIYTHN